MNDTPSLFDGPGDGEGSGKDPRLAKQLVRVYDALNDGRWHALAELSDTANAPEASVSARIRDLRKPRFGGFDITQRHAGDGLHQYRMSPESGDPRLVHAPQSEPRSAKAEARERINAFLDGWDRLGWTSDEVYSAHGAPLLVSDLREMLR